MLQHVYERASLSRYLTKLVIATDDPRIYDAARSFGALVQMTRADHLSGTDRVAEVASSDRAEVIVNIQGDEPLIDPSAIECVPLMRFLKRIVAKKFATQGRSIRVEYGGEFQLTNCPSVDHP